MYKHDIVRLNEEIKRNAFNNYIRKSYLYEGKTLTPEEKIDMWHNGSRKINIKACSFDKLNMYKQLCRKKGYTAEVKAINAELKRRKAESNAGAVTEGFGRPQTAFSDAMVSYHFTPEPEPEIDLHKTLNQTEPVSLKSLISVLNSYKKRQVYKAINFYFKQLRRIINTKRDDLRIYNFAMYLAEEAYRVLGVYSDYIQNQKEQEASDRESAMRMHIMQKAQKVFDSEPVMSDIQEAQEAFAGIVTLTHEEIEQKSNHGDNLGWYRETGIILKKVEKILRSAVTAADDFKTKTDTVTAFFTYKNPSITNRLKPIYYYTNNMLKKLLLRQQRHADDEFLV
jgi:hypothetical protein